MRASKILPNIRYRSLSISSCSASKGRRLTRQSRGIAQKRATPHFLSLAIQVHTKIIVIGFALLLYAASLLLPAYHKCGDSDVAGYAILLMGWLGLINFDPRWFSNFLFIIIIFHLSVESIRKNLIYPYILSTMALSCIVIRPGPCQARSSLAIGGYLWVAAMLIVSIYYIIKYKNDSQVDG